MNEPATWSSDLLASVATACGIDLHADQGQQITPDVFRAPAHQGVFAFKRFETPALAEKESSLIAHLDAHPSELYKVQTIIRGSRGELLVQTHEGPVMVTHWIDGQRKSYRNVDAGGWTELGRTLAGLHQGLDGFESSAMPTLADEHRSMRLDEQLHTIEDDRRSLERMGAPEHALALMDARRELLERHFPLCLAQWPSAPARAIHNDYNINNYLFHPSGPPSIIDWNRAICAPRAYELVRCLNHLPLESPDLARCFVSAYLELRSLEASTVEWAVHAALLSHATKHWPVALALRGAPGSLERLAELNDVLQALVNRETELMHFFQSLLAQHLDDRR